MVGEVHGFVSWKAWWWRKGGRQGSYEVNKAKTNKTKTIYILIKNKIKTKQN
jgi:hypothetical protein